MIYPVMEVAIKKVKSCKIMLNRNKIKDYQFSDFMYHTQFPPLRSISALTEMLIIESVTLRTQNVAIS